MAATPNLPQDYPIPNDTPYFFTFKNDYIFTEAMKDTKVLKGFLMCLTGIEEESIKNITVLPRHLNKDDPAQKLGILDCKLELNNDSIINIELQILCYPYWDSRSLFYISKMLTDQYREGPNGYSNIKRCIHVCILDFNYTDIEDDFYTVYRLRDDEYGLIYTNLLEIHVIQLKKRDAPGVRDKYPRLHRWTQLFSIKTRKELECMTEQDEYIKAAAQAMDDLNLDRDHREAAFYRFIQLMDEQTILAAQEEAKEATKRALEEADSYKEKAAIYKKEADNFKKEADNFKREADSFKKEADSFKKEADSFKKEATDLKEENNSLKKNFESAQTQLRSNLIIVLEQKFGALPDAALTIIHREIDMVKLNNWLTQAIFANSMVEFINGVPELTSAI